ncbi:MAG TPA: amidohydrolase family protein [Galbitalea sp.]
MTDYPVIDFRTRPPVPEFSDSFPLDPRRVEWMCSRIDSRVPDSYKEQSLERWREEMRAANVVKAIVIGNCLPPQIVPNDFLVELQERAPEVLGFAAIDPIGIAHDPVAETVRCIEELGLAGIYLEPGLSLRKSGAHRAGIYMDDIKMIPIYEACRDLDVPVIIVASPFAGNDLSYADPTRVDRIAEMFPTLPIICGHGCWPYAAEVIAVAYKRENVFVSPDFYSFMPGTGPFVDAMRHPALSRQIIFATGYPLFRFDDLVEKHKALGLPEDCLRAVLHDNAARLLRLQ